MHRCYKCGATEELSKRGKTVMMCRPCRRIQYHEYHDRINPDRAYVRHIKDTKTNNNDRIIAKYA